MEGHFSPITSWIDLQTRDNLTPEQVVEFYNDWAETYDESVKESQSNTIALKAALEQFPDMDVRHKLEVLDIAAGTGSVGQNLFEAGFRRIDALGNIL